jgi:translocation and assembly module TamB
VKWLTWSGVALVTVLAMLCAVVLWSVNTQAGTRWVVGLAKQILGEQLAIHSVTGTIAGPLQVRGLRFIDPTTGLQVAVREIDLDLALRALLRTTVQVDSARIAGVQVQLANNPPEDEQPFSLDPPIDTVVRQLAITDVDIRRDGESLVVITRADAAASWTAAGIAITKLDALSPQGEVHLTGRVQQRGMIIGDGAGRFRWQLGELDYAGSLQADTQGHNNVVTVNLTAPLAATLAATLTQTPTPVWSWTLEIPSFDPRDALLPDSSFTQLAAHLKGNGDPQRNQASGSITIDGQKLDLESLQIARSAQVNPGGENPGQESSAGFDIDSRLRLAQGTVNAKGTIVTAVQPVRAQLALDWQNLDIPAQWAGQVLHTQGRIDFAGSSERYAANGTLSVGPQKRVANIALRIEGSSDAVELQRLDIVQSQGKLASTGELTLKPLGWTISATAQQFDPGAFAPAWNGALSFGLQSSGTVTEAGPAATLAIDNLRGQLRNRALNGTANLTLRPGMRLAGVLDLRSGESHIHVDGDSAGDSNAASVNAVATAQIPNLADWVPDASGSLHAKIAASGAWPALKIVGNARGSALQFATSRAGSLQVEFDVVNPQKPSGTVQFALVDVAAAGFHFDSLQVAADGDMPHHRVTLLANGKPLAADLAVEGALRDGAWAGRVNRLVFDLENAAKLTLQAPAQVRYASNAASVSQSCFADGDIRLCLAGDLAADGAMQASYSLQRVPLTLANALAPGTLPVTIDGALDGEGRITRLASGMLRGDARITSTSGKISQPPTLANATPTSLLTYDNLALIADLDGETAHLRLNATLDREGTLAGDVTLTGLGTTATSMRGKAQATLPSIAVVEAIVPQLANVQGKLALQADIAGTLDQPEISGDLSLVQLAADVPELGIKLRHGQFTIKPAPAQTGQFALDGAIDSGEGKLSFTGIAATNGTVQLDILGNRFLAADIPGAKVLITPDLDFTRDAQRLFIGGKVIIPEAMVDLQKLPRGTRVQRASDDVVIIEAQNQQNAAAQSSPLAAEVTVVLGDKVDLTGFGLAAKVAGQLVVKERPGEPTTGSGEIRVAGTYKAYGQDLTVQQGQLLFAGTPLDNPRLNIVAVRTVGEVNAGLRVTGSAQNPLLTVFSDPPMGQANALAYLVTGKPLEEVGSGNAEGDALQTAARSLGTAAGGLLARKIGGRLGVDEVGIKDSDTLGGSALTVGQYLSPRLYLSYGVGLFQPGEVVTLRYKLKESLAVQAERGPKDTRTGIEYRIEK